ncbi:MAG: helix-turn-helix domain-containing protein [Pseudonocardia sp.]|nr:helix-turn-helix domain-containing protein [Pseudonocardia sp.]
MAATRTVDADLLARVAALRADGLTPKEIARSLGLRPSAVTPLIGQIARQTTTEPEVTGCWISPGWRRNLLLDGHDDWPDLPTIEDGTEGLVGVVVARRDRRHRLSVAGYLVDTFCLGVKDALGPRSISDRDLPAFRSGYFAAFGDADPLEVPLELARHLVWGAVDHARRLGFAPHPDFEPVSGHLGTWDETSAIGFGRDGFPFYICGPHDDPHAVIRTLTRTVGEGNFHFVVPVG